MRMTIIHPSIGHRRGRRPIRSWQMEPLPAAAIAGLTPDDIEIRFYDDRMEWLPFDEATDAVVMSVETYTARRSYEIASEYRRRGVPVVFGGFHPTLVPDECERFAESIVVGEAEGIWAEVVDDLRHGTLRKRYHTPRTTSLTGIRIDRSIFRGKGYLPLGLVETGRGCHHSCEFCAIQSFFERTHRSRPIDAVIEELELLRERTRLFFFVDDNFAANIEAARELLVALEKLNIRWVTQMSIEAAQDEEFLHLVAKSGCQGVLIGFESLAEENLRSMGKGFAIRCGAYHSALEKLRRHGIGVYGTFLFGNDTDTVESFTHAVEFAIEHRFYLAAFNHLTPFPGTPLYERLARDKRLRFAEWWLDPRYRYNDLPFFPKGLSPDEVRENCLKARRRFFGLRSIFKRGLGSSNSAASLLFRQFLPINLMHRFEICRRDGHPLGDQGWTGELLEAG